MKLTGRMKEALGISMLVSAVSLVTSFIVLSCRKRSALQALLYLAAAEGMAGTTLCLLESERRKMRRRTRRLLKREELFNEDNSAEAEAHVRHVLGGGDAEPRPAREVPRDEDATEEDFQ